MASSLRNSTDSSDAAFNVRVDFPTRTVEVHGELDIASAAHLRAAIESLLPGEGDVTLDLAGLTFLDASGLRVFQQIDEALAAHGDRLVFRNPNARHRRVFMIAGLPSMLVTP